MGDRHRGAYAQDGGATHEEKDDVSIALSCRLETKEWYLADEQVATHETEWQE